MTHTATPQRNYYQDPESGIDYLASRTGPLSMRIHRQEPADRQIQPVAVISFSDIYNPDGPWYAAPLGQTGWNRVHERRYQTPESAAMAVAREDVVITRSQRRHETELPAIRTEAETDLERFLQPEPADTTPLE